MSTFKQYAKRAKERLKNGFWQQAMEHIRQEKQVAATLGLNTRVVGQQGHELLQRQIYDYEGFCRDQPFDKKVKEILASNQTVQNPIMLLADQEYMKTLSPEEKQQYLLQVAAKYRQAVEKYNQLRS